MKRWPRILIKINKRKKVSARLFAGVLAFSLILPLGPADASPPSVSTDEAVYVNMDYYGGIEDVSVVKGCSLNGISQFQDYGDYESVTNMSTYDQPIITPDGVQWNLGSSSGTQRFYYNCKVRNDAIILPWNIDVSYKLNGVPCQAESLAGASGLVEINIKVEPNDAAKPYYKNNMLLQVATYINTENAYSFDAPGSQLQAVGTYKAVLFAALPGESDNYTIRIGTDSFESKGITMMMIPGTLKQLEDIKDIKEAKDTLQDSYNAIYSSMNDVLNTMDSMSSGLSDLKTGVEGTEDARSTFSAGKDQMYKYGDTALEDLDATNQQLKKLIPYFKTGQNMTRDISKKIDNIVDTMQQLQDPLTDASSSLDTTHEDLESLQDMLNTLNGQIEDTLTNLGDVASVGMATPYEGTQLQGEAEMAQTLGENSDKIDSLLAEAAAMTETTNEIISITQDLIDQTADLDNTLDSYNDDLIDLLGDCQTLTKLMSNSLDSSLTFLKYSKNLVQVSGDKLDNASASSLKGLTDILDKSILGLGSIPTMRNANNTIKMTLDREFDKFEKENQFLNLDATASLVSFTSDKNPPPSSAQIILRTKEISLDSGKSGISDLEPGKTNVGFVARIKNLWKKIVEIFK
jgi:ABC-type transporter Mla subunit MlaD